MGLVSNDLGDWIANPEAEPESAKNLFGAEAALAAQAQLDAHLHGLWRRATYRVHKWLDADWKPGGHGDGLTR